MQLRRAFSSFLLICTTVALTWTFNHSLGAERGIIQGSVTDQEGGSVSDITIRLKIMQGQRQTGAAETKTNQAGKYAFKDLKRDDAFRYLPYAAKDGVPYYSGMVRFQENKNVVEAPEILIFPVEIKPTHIIGQENISIEFGRRDLARITHSITLQNTGDKTYDPRGDSGVPIEFGLKEGGFQLEYIRGLSSKVADIDGENHKLIYRQVIPPGENNEVKVQFTYLFEMEERSVPFSFASSIPREIVNIIFLDKKIDLKDTTLVEQPPLDREGHTVYIYSGGPFPPNSPVSFTIKGLFLDRDIGYFLLFAGFAFVFLISLYFIWRRPPNADSATQREKDREECFSALAQLEKLHSQRKISESAYKEEKLRLRELLFDLMVAKSDDQAA